jgi:hypothetical protein
MISNTAFESGWRAHCRSDRVAMACFGWVVQTTLVIFRSGFVSMFSSLMGMSGEEQPGTITIQPPELDEHPPMNDVSEVRDRAHSNPPPPLDASTDQVPTRNRSASLGYGYCSGLAHAHHAARLWREPPNRHLLPHSRLKKKAEQARRKSTSLFEYVKRMSMPAPPSQATS